MKSTFAFTLLCLISAMTFQALGQADTPAITPAKKIVLFDGKSFSGWTFVSKDTDAPVNSIWSITNRAIYCAGKPNGYARTLKSFRDYHLHVEWRFPDGAGNSGVFLHVNPPDKVWPMCFEAQLLSGNAGEIRFNGGSSANGATTKNPRSVPRQKPSSEKPLGEWNSYDILCHSNTITVRVNGVPQNEITGTSVNSGAIALQAEGKPVEFRNLYVQPLP
ncbi:MAG TPA: DUF1080 domain-containing protein [Verrucomicrobiae bacterium]|nr:DUF1080 domain-containing protein [Verrucomicrobiae bacterium]